MGFNDTRLAAEQCDLFRTFKCRPHSLTTTRRLRVIGTSTINPVFSLGAMPKKLGRVSFTVESPGCELLFRRSFLARTTGITQRRFQSKTLCRLLLPDCRTKGCPTFHGAPERLQLSFRFGTVHARPHLLPRICSILHGHVCQWVCFDVN